MRVTFHSRERGGYFTSHPPITTTLSGMSHPGLAHQPQEKHAKTCWPSVTLRMPVLISAMSPLAACGRHHKRPVLSYQPGLPSSGEAAKLAFLDARAPSPAPPPETWNPGPARGWLGENTGSGSDRPDLRPRFCHSDELGELLNLFVHLGMGIMTQTSQNDSED